MLWCVRRTASALSFQMAGTQGRGGTSQSEAGGRLTNIQGETEGFEKEEERREEEGSDKSKDEKDQEDNEDSESTSSAELETEELMNPPAKIQALTEPSQDDVNEGKEGIVDENDDDSSPCNVEAHHKVQERWPSP